MQSFAAHFTAAAVGLSALLSAPVQSQQAWPAKEVRLLIGNSPGSTPDIVARTFSAGLGRRLDQPVVVDNRAGADGIIAANTVATAKPDGHTLGLISQQTLGIAPVMRKSLPFDPLRSFTPIALVIDSTTGNAIAVHESLPVKTFGQLLDYARANPNQITYSTTVASGSLFMEWLKRRAGIQMREVRYKSTPMALQDAMAGRVAVAVNSPAALLPAVQDGKLRFVAVASPERLADWSDVPTMNEIYPDYGMRAFFALMGPAGLAKEVVARLNRDSDAVIRSAEFQAMLKKIIWFNKDGARTPEATAEIIRTENEGYRQLAKEIGLKPQ